MDGNIELSQICNGGDKEMRFRKLKGKLKEEDYTQKEIAEILDITPQAFNSKINNRTQFTLDEVIKMTNILKIDNPVEIFFTNGIPKMQQTN
ncbi:helix-turn-helix domain-containing protein [Faecalimicrobium sp. JNUCC 81]